MRQQDKNKQTNNINKTIKGDNNTLYGMRSRCTKYHFR